MKRPQLTVRDLLWLTLVVGLALGWWQYTRSQRLEVENCKYRVNFLMEYMVNHGFKIDVGTDGSIEIDAPERLEVVDR